MAELVLSILSIIAMVLCESAPKNRPCHLSAASLKPTPFLAWLGWVTFVLLLQSYSKMRFWFQRTWRDELYHHQYTLQSPQRRLDGHVKVSSLPWFGNKQGWESKMQNICGCIGSLWSLISGVASISRGEEQMYFLFSNPWIFCCCFWTK